MLFKESTEMHIRRQRYIISEMTWREKRLFIVFLFMLVQNLKNFYKNERSENKL